MHDIKKNNTPTSGLPVVTVMTSTSGSMTGATPTFATSRTVTPFSIVHTKSVKPELWPAMRALF